MRTIGLAIALFLAFLAPSIASAAPEGGAVSKDQRAKGMADAPALVSAAGSDCQVSDARLVGQGTDPKTKAKQSLYEVACTGSEGLFVQKAGDEPPAVFTCAEMATGAEAKKGSPECILPANIDPRAGLAPFIAKAGVVCTPDKVRAMGHTASDTYFELACKEGPPGFVLKLSAPPRLDKPAQGLPCSMFDQTGNVKCTLTDRATQMTVVDTLVKQSGKPCTVKDRGFILETQQGESYYEVACQDGKGYALEQSAKGALVRAIDCSQADAIGGGCKLTDTRQAKTEQTGLYSQLAKKANFDCTVSGYAPLPVAVAGKEVVELACSNRPDGAIAVFPVSSSQPGEIYDCAHAELKSYRCSLTKPSAAYPKLTADLKAFGKNSCVVSSARVVGVTAEQRGYIEVGCADGLPGYMLEYSMTPLAAKSALVCVEAKGIGGGCTLPGNVLKN